MSADAIEQRLAALADHGGGCVLRSESGREWVVDFVTREGDVLVAHGTEQRCQYLGSNPPEFALPVTFFGDCVAITGLAIRVVPEGESP